MIDGFRYALTGVTDGSIQTGIIVMLVMNLILWITTALLSNKGWRLKS